MYVNSNISSSVSQNYLSRSNEAMSNTMNRLASGKRINSAADDAAGLSIATRMTAQTNGMDVAMRNAEDGISMINTAESALGSVSDILQRMRELAVQADNGTYSASDKTSMQNEYVELSDEIKHIAEGTTFNGTSLLQGDGAGAPITISLHISDKAVDNMDIDFASATAQDLAVDNANAGIDISADAQAAITALDTALQTVADQRADLGSKVNRLDFVKQNLSSTQINTEASRSRIEDANMAKEMSELTKQRVLNQSSMSMLRQANSQPQAVLSLLQG